MEQMREHRDEYLKYWYKRTRINSKKSFGKMEKSTDEQVNDILMDKERLIKRTQIKRSKLHVIGVFFNNLIFIL